MGLAFFGSLLSMTSLLRLTGPPGPTPVPMPYACPERQRRYQEEAYRQLVKRRPWTSMLNNARKRAAKRGQECLLTHEWFEERWTGVCEITGLPFGKGSMAASVDRIDSEGIYEPDNCRIVLFCVNVFRGTLTDAQMRKIARRLV